MERRLSCDHISSSGTAEPEHELAVPRLALAFRMLGLVLLVRFLV